jgi:uncharacterized protein (DUF1684 family)
MSLRLLPAAVLVVSLVGCADAPSSAPELPPVDEAAYKAEHEGWRKARLTAIASAMEIIGLWPLSPGETPFGSDPSLPIVLPAPSASAKVGTFKRDGEKITVIPASGSPLRLADGSLLNGPVELKSVMAVDTTVLALGSIRLQVEEVFEKPRAGVPPRRWVSAWDQEHPATKNLPPVEVFPLDQRWRVAARFEPFDAPKPTRVPDVRGGFMDLLATGQLVFRLNDREQRLTAIGFEGRDDLFVMFKDTTNASTTYSGYRILFPTAPADEEWIVLDFNLAENPPCAYSRFTTCPLPPPENKMDVAVEAGEKRYPAAKGYVPAGGGC